jgi:SAM-dependent methyltransferase
MATPDPETQRAELIEGWESGSRGWGERADQIRGFGMPVSEWMLDALALQPGQRVLELAAGPGDTGFMAAELIRPAGGTLVTSDAAEGMLEVARGRAAKLGIDNVEFKRLELEWIDLPTASVDAALCRWGLMLIVDPAAAVQEVRRVLRPGGRFALAVWDRAEFNPWATIPGKALVELGHAEPPDPNGPGMFSLAGPGRLQELLEGAGFQEVLVDAVDVERSSPSVDAYLEETVALSGMFARPWRDLSEEQRAEVATTIGSLAEPFTLPDGSIRLPGRARVAAATA